VAVKATNDVTLDFPDGSLAAVIGPNGAGKSTFFNLITGALKPDSGQVLLDGVDLAGRSPPEIGPSRHRPRVPGASIFKSLTVQETCWPPSAPISAHPHAAQALSAAGDARPRRACDGAARPRRQTPSHGRNTFAW